MTENNFSRRDFIKLSALGIAVAAGVSAITKAEASEGAKGEQQWAMVIDQAKCIGCDQCTSVCNAHNDINPDIHWNKVEDAGEINGKMVYLPRPCMQCEHAPCVEVCPVGARKFGNILDPNSEVSYMLRTKRVFIQLKEELGTSPRFFYYFDV